MTLQDWMARHGVRDAEMAQRLDGTVTRSQVSRIRRGVSRPSLETAAKIQEVTGIPAATFAQADCAEARA